MVTVKLITEKETVKIETEEGSNLLAVLQKCPQSNISAPCGGKGLCGKCKVRILTAIEEGLSREMLSKPELKEGFRLACLVTVRTDLEIELLIDKNAKILTKAAERDMALIPKIGIKNLKIQPPSAKDCLPDLNRIERDSGYQVDFHALNLLSKAMRRFDSLKLVTFDNHIIDVLKKDTLYGVAVDIGTTTIAAYLIDLTTGKQLAVCSSLNPQRKFGADVISRMDFCRVQSNGLKTLSTVIRQELNRIVDFFKREFAADNICHITVAANTVMLHILAGIVPDAIAESPFIPAFISCTEFHAQELELSVNAVVTLLPSVSAYIGSDITAGVAATNVDKENRTTLFLDLGTNGEIVLGSKKKMVACSAAAGPAFEGANISCGMAGVSGAISRAFLDKGGELRYSVIENEEPKGICGSALLDIAAILISNGIVDETGAFADASTIKNADLKNRLKHSGSGKIFEITNSVTLTQQDIRELQLAKAAISAGIRVLCNELEIKITDIKQVYLAGGFGSYMDSDSAVILGLIPMHLKNKVKVVGNTAGLGAKYALKNRRFLQKVVTVSNNIQNIELSQSEEFNDYFMDGMVFEPLQ